MSRRGAMSRQREYQGFRDLVVYQKSYQLAKEIHEVSKTFPKEERYSLTDQIRRASRSIPVTIAEAWKKRRYPKAFISRHLLTPYSLRIRAYHSHYTCRHLHSAYSILIPIYPSLNQCLRKRL